MITKLYRYGGLLAGIVLVAFGIGSIVIGLNGRSEVRTDVKREQIVGTPDMTPAAIKKEATAAGLKNVSFPSCSIADKPVHDGASAKCFAQYMRIHTLEATGGQTYAQMPRYQTADGKGTNVAAQAVKNPKSGQPVDNPARNIWVTETALTTALNTSFFAESVGLFSIVMGVAMLLTGIGFLILAWRLLAVREELAAETPAAKAATAVG